MTRQYQKVVYQPDKDAQDEFNVIVNGPEYDAWIKGDKTIPLADVVDSFQTFVSPQGTQGKLGLASKQQLDNAFGTHTDTDVVTEILEKGSLLSVSNKQGYSTTNDSFLSGNLVSKGSRAGGR